jgi:alpha-beta hydrolase superfamily lysophospholipase
MRRLLPAWAPLRQLGTLREKAVLPQGNTMADIVFVGDAPGYHDEKAGLPFQGDAGGKLDGMLKAMGGLMYLAKSVAPGNLISMTSDSMNKRFPDRDVPHAWLTRDPEIRKEYEADPFCGTPSSLRFNHSMTKMMCQATDPENLKKVPDSLPIAMFCGEDDSAGGFGKGPKTALEIYRKYGKNITLKLYPGARHEVLNEINRDEIYQDILSFLNSVVEK